MVSARRKRIAGTSHVLLAATILAGIVGCGETSATSSSEKKATVKGVVTVSGKPVSKGKISFDPSNVNRKMASATSAEIGPDGSYSVTTLLGDNIVSFELPGVATPKNRLNYSRLNYTVKAGENTFDATLNAH